MSKRLLSQLGAELQRETGLSAADYEVLVNLSEATHGRLRPSELGGFGQDPYGGTRAGFTATGEIKRSDFGVDFNAVLETGGVVVADKVAIALEIEAVLDA